MIYKIYPVSEDKWLKIWKKIKMVCRQQGLQIITIIYEDFRDGLLSGKKKGDPLNQTSIIYLAKQAELFKSSNVFNISNNKSNKSITYNQRDSSGRFIKIIQNNP